MIRCAPSGRKVVAFFFALVFPVASSLVPLQAQAGSQGTGLRLTDAVFEPYRFTHAKLESEAGIIGDIRVTGMDWNGGSRLLFSGRSKAWTKSVDVVFYVDESLKSLAIDAETGSGRQTLTLDLAALALGEAVPDDAELARRAMLRDLPLPFTSPRQTRPPRIFLLAASGLSDAASQIAAACIALEPPTKALGALSLFIVAASGLAALRRRMRPASALTATVCLSLLALSAVAFLIPREPRIIIAHLPQPEGEGPLPYRGDLVLGEDAAGEASVIRYSTSDSGWLSFVAISTPGDRGIPLAVMEARPGSFVFSSSPVVTARGTDLELHCERWTTGWMAWQDR